MLVHGTDAVKPPTRVVILGAGGFLGRALMQALRDDGVPVLPLGSKDLDLTRPDAGETLAGMLLADDAVVFLSAITPDRGRGSSALLLNLRMAQAVCAAAAKIRPAHLVYASSDAVYPFIEEAISESSAAATPDLYGAMHRTREIMLAMEAAVPLAIVRFTAIYGIGDSHNSYGPNRFIRQALNGEPIALFGNGEELRDHLYIDDAIAILRNVLLHKSTGLANAASGMSISFRELADLIVALCPGATVAPQPRRSSVTHRRFDISALRAAFPALEFTPLRNGLTAIVSSMRAPDAARAPHGADHRVDIGGHRA